MESKLKPVLIIAEAGVNHNGDLETAKKMVQIAAEAGADVVKFQTFVASKLATADAQLADYQKKNLNESAPSSQSEMLKKLELSFEDHKVLIEECRKYSVKFLSTAFDFESLHFLNSLNLEMWKIPSGEVTNLPYLEIIGSFNKRIILSTGMCSLEEVDAAFNVLVRAGTAKEKITVLHCTTDYPAQLEDVNLSAMVNMGRRFGVEYGYSDHTLGIEVPIAAAALGATVIEKHFTISRAMQGPDHAASLEPKELEAMIRAVRNIEKAIGDGIKRPTQNELKNAPIARKSIVAAVHIKKGDLFTSENLTTARPGSGISPMKWYEVIGKPAIRDYKAGEQI